jgi:hypothetical protein
MHTAELPPRGQVVTTTGLGLSIGPHICEMRHFSPKKIQTDPESAKSG